MWIRGSVLMRKNQVWVIGKVCDRWIRICDVWEKESSPPPSVSLWEVEPNILSGSNKKNKQRKGESHEIS
jgi:hypothetical protein